MIDNVDNSVKVIVVGNGGVGKTSMLRRFCKGDFTNEYKKTVGTDFHEKNIFLSTCDQVVNLMLWDTAGQEVFDSITASYYRGAGACILAFSCTDRDSFMAVERWKGKVEAQCGKNTVAMVLVKTKADLESEATVTDAEANALAEKLSISYYSTSTKDNINVANVFEHLAESCLHTGTFGNEGNALEITSRTTDGPASGNNTSKSPMSSSPSTAPSGKNTSRNIAQQTNTISMAPNVQRAKKKKSSFFSCAKF